jgi:hypothetical protein
MSNLSVFESFGFRLYFLGNALSPASFRHIENSKNISLSGTSKAFNSAFPRKAITICFEKMLKAPEYITIEKIRNILVHRVSGRRSIRSWGTPHPDGEYTLIEEQTWHLPGSAEQLVFDEAMIQRHLDEATRLLVNLISASLEFVKI